MLRLLMKQWRCKVGLLLDRRRSPCPGRGLFIMFFVYVQIVFLVVMLMFRNSPLDDGTVAANSDHNNANNVQIRSLLQTVDLNSSAACSPDIFRYYYATRDYFPREGKWVTDGDPYDSVQVVHNSPDTRNNVYSRRPSTTTTIDVTKNIKQTLDRYVPDLCKFRYGGRQKPLPPDTVRHCFRQKRIMSVATMGDSNGAHHFDAIVRLLNDSGSGNRCKMIASEYVDHTLLMPDVAYYARYDHQLVPLLRATFRHCSSCVSRIHRCQLDTDRRTQSEGNGSTAADKDQSDELQLEHLSMVSVLDSSLKIDVPHNHFAVNLQYRADTSQEFLLKYYLRGRYPDLLIIFPPFNHDKKSQTRTSLSIRLRYFVDLLDLYLPASTRVIWVPSFTEFESRKPPVWANRKMHGMLGTAKIDQFNHELYRILRDKLQDRVNGTEPRTYGFFDQVRVSASREDMSVDGVHMTGEWYTEMVSYILQILCSDVIDDEFDFRTHT